MDQIRPIWIVLDGGDLFEGHQLNWADCFFSNATRRIIKEELERGNLKQESYSIREMTDEELAKSPEVVEFCKELIQRYGTY